MTRRTIGLVGFALCLGLVAVASPAGAGECFASAGNGDGRIRRGSQPYIGQGVFNCTGIPDQTVSRVVGPGVKKGFDVKVKNDSGGAADITVNGFATGEVSDFKLMAFRPDKANKDVTAKVIGGSGVVYKNVADGASTPRLHIVVKGKATVVIGDDVRLAVGGRVGSDAQTFADRPAVFAGLPL